MVGVPVVFGMMGIGYLLGPTKVVLAAEEIAIAIGHLRSFAITPLKSGLQHK